MDEHAALARRVAIERGWEPEEVPPEADPPPAGAEFLWEWFLDLSAGRASNGFGPSPLSWQDIAAWAALTGQAPTPWEVSVLRRLDRVYLEVAVSNDTTPGRNASDRPRHLRVRR